MTGSPPTPRWGRHAVRGRPRRHDPLLPRCGDARRSLLRGRDGDTRPRWPPDRRAAPRALPSPCRSGLGRALSHGDPLRAPGCTRRGAVLGGPPRTPNLHRLRRPPGEPGVLLHRSRGQRRRALLGSIAHRVVMGARTRRDGDALPRPERVPQRASHRRRRRGRDRAGRVIRGSCASVGGRCRNRSRVLCRRPRVRRDRRARQSGRLRERRRLPPSHGDERVELPRSRTPDAGTRPRPGRPGAAGCRRPRRARRTPARPRLHRPRRRLRGWSDPGFDDPWTNRIRATAS